MNWAYIHLIINHFPIIGVSIGTALLAAGVIFKNQGVTISGLGNILFASLMAIVAYMTGNPAEELMKGLPEIAKSLISRHENIATVGMYLMVTAGLLAASSLYSIWKKDKTIRLLIMLTLAFSIISSGTMVFIGLTGGQIRHSEFRNEATKQYIIDHQNDVEADN
ncbi:MAG: hypothetical protein Q7U54_12700 [Bacteroidales bacterium]|nr:hypothetical protein [Bacteroidales bacterium]